MCGCVHFVHSALCSVLCLMVCCVSILCRVVRVVCGTVFVFCEYLPVVYCVGCVQLSCVFFLRGV